jgi:hypothetical protein
MHCLEFMKWASKLSNFNYCHWWFSKWSNGDLLVVEPGQCIMGVYDMDEVVMAID